LNRTTQTYDDYLIRLSHYWLINRLTDSLIRTSYCYCTRLYLSQGDTTGAVVMLSYVLHPKHTFRHILKRI